MKSNPDNEIDKDNINQVNNGKNHDLDDLSTENKTNDMIHDDAMNSNDELNHQINTKNSKNEAKNDKQAIDQEALCQRLIQQNTKLRHEIEIINNHLQKVLDKQKQKDGPIPLSVALEFDSKVLQNELKNSYKELENLEKENDGLQKKCNADNNEKTMDMIKVYEDDIEKLRQELKLLENQKRENEKKLDLMRQDTNSNQLINRIDELKYWKGKLQEIENKDEYEAKITKKKNEYIQKLEIQFQELCQKAKVDPNTFNIQSPKPNKKIIDLSKKNATTSSGYSKSVADLKQLQNKQSQQQLNKVQANQSQGHNGNQNQNHNLNLRDSTAPGQRLELSPVPENRTSKGTRELSKARISLAAQQKLSILDEPYSEEAFKDLYYAVQVLTKAIKIHGKKNEKALETIKHSISLSEKENVDLKEKLKEKDKEHDMLKSKYDELKKALKSNQLPPIEELQSAKDSRKNVQLKKANLSSEANLSLKENKTFEIAEQTNNNHSSNDIFKATIEEEEGSIDHTKSKNGMSSPKIKIKPSLNQLLTLRKEEKGKARGMSRQFDDMILIKHEKNVKIIGVKVWHNPSGISGIQGFYSCEGKNMMSGFENIRPSGMKDKVTTFIVENDDYIKCVSGFIDKAEFHIQALIFHSAKGLREKIGEQTNESKLFKFDVTESEYPVCFYGTLEPVFGNIISFETQVN